MERRSEDPRAEVGLRAVLTGIARTAASLCEADNALIVLVEGDRAAVVARHGRLPSRLRLGETYPLSADLVGNRAITGRRTIHIRDLARTAGARFRESRAFQLPLGVRTVLATPLLRDGAAIGAIAIRRTRVQPFTPKQIALLKTFADQAAVAIENARLSRELGARNRELMEALERETATSEILRVISKSPTNLRPVFDAIVQSAGRLCDAAFGALQLFDGERLTLDAHYGISPEDVAIIRERVFPMRPDRGSSIGRAITTRASVHIEDIRSDPEYRVSVVKALEGYRTVLSVPMLRGEVPLGVLNLWRREVRPFSRAQIEMVQTFADQAVIAIENVRLFTELQARNRELTEALERQTATSAILRVISQSPTDIQPVLETIVEHAGRVCGAFDAIVFLVEGDKLVRTAHRGPCSHHGG